jgi:hypothetical protein
MKNTSKQKMPLKRDYKWYSYLLYYLFFRGIKFFHRKFNYVNPWFWLTKSDAFRKKFAKQGRADFHERYEKAFNDIKTGHAFQHTDSLLRHLFIPLWSILTTATCLKVWTVFLHMHSAYRYFLLVFVLLLICLLLVMILAHFLGSESGRRLDYFKEFEKFGKEKIVKYTLVVLLIMCFSFFLMICSLICT